MFVHPGQGQGLPRSRQASCQLQSKPAALGRLAGAALVRVQGEPHHQGPGAPLPGHGEQPGGEEFGGPAPQGWKGGDGEAQGIAAGKSDPAPPQVEGEGRSGPGGRHSALAHGGGQGASAGLELLEHGTEPAGRPLGGEGFLAAPDASRHHHLVAMGL